MDDKSKSMPRIPLSADDMKLGSEENEFLEVAVAAIPTITETIAGFAAEHREGALEAAERCYLDAARAFGCLESAGQTWVSVVMRMLRNEVEKRVIVRAKLEALLSKLSHSTKR